MNKFNLSFKGEIHPGKDPQETRLKVGAVLGVKDPKQLERYFCGDTVILLKNLDRKSAAEYYARLNNIGITVRLVKAASSEAPTGKRQTAEKPGSSPVAKPEKSGQNPASPENLSAKQRRDARAGERQKAQREALKNRPAKDQRAGNGDTRKQNTRAEDRERRVSRKRQKKAQEKRRRDKPGAASKDAQLVKKAPDTTASEDRKAAMESVARRQAEQAARRRTAKTERERRDALEQERRAFKDAAKLTADEAVAKHRAQVADRKHREAEKKRILAARQEAISQRQAMEEVVIQRAVTELSQQPSLDPVDARVKTSLEVPRDDSTPLVKISAEQARARARAGIPNLYSLKPFRNSPEIKARHDISARLANKNYLMAGLALLSLVAIAVTFISRPIPPPITGARAMAVASDAGPALLAGDQLLLHDRAGFATESISLAALGLTELGKPMLFEDSGELLANGRLEANDQQDPGIKQLLRCNLKNLSCVPLSPEVAEISVAAMVIHPLTGDIFVADPVAAQILKISSEGAVLARRDITLAQHPVMQVEAGLLFINSANGPAISVLRYDDNAFGEQLDEVLLLPPPAIAAEQSLVWDFNKAADTWWATLFNPESNSVGIYTFDSKWNYRDQLKLARGSWPEQLASWGERTILRDPLQVPILRFNGQGSPEAPLVSSLLEDLVSGQRKTHWISNMVLRAALVLFASLAIAGFVRGKLHSARSLVYRTNRELGAQPVDDLADALAWVPPAPDRSARMKRTATAYTALALSLLSIAIALQVSVLQLAALMIALAGPVIFLVLLNRSPLGHIGLAPGKLLLADHNGMYHLGSGARLQHRGPFLLIDDVVVFTGTPLLPAFSAKHIQGEVATLARAGIRIDGKTLTIKLLECRHPLARGAIAVAVSLLIATSLLALSL